MTGVTRVQTVSMGIDSAESSTNRSQSFGAPIGAGNYMVCFFSTRDNSPGNITVSDNKANTWSPLVSVYDSNGGRGVAVTYALANSAAQAAAPTVTLNKGGTTCGVGGTLFELSTPATTFLDAAAITATNATTTASVTLSSTSYTNDLVLAAICTGPTSFVTLTPTSGYTTADSINGTGPAFQQAVIYRDTTTSGVYTPGWTLSQSTQWEIVGLAVRGTTSAPTISAVSSTTPLYQGSLTITGVNFGASTGTLTVGGVTQATNSWSDTSITVSSLARGSNKYGTAVNVQLTTSTSTNSNVYTGITGLLPQSGWGYMDLTTPNSTSANRITAVADLAAGDQLAYDNQSGQVTVYSDATFAVGSSVTSFNVEAWFTGNGWGTAAAQTLGTGGVKNAVSKAWRSTGGGLPKPSSDGKIYSNYLDGNHP